MMEWLTALGSAVLILSVLIVLMALGVWFEDTLVRVNEFFVSLFLIAIIPVTIMIYALLVQK